MKMHVPAMILMGVILAGGCQNPVRQVDSALQSALEKPRKANVESLNLIETFLRAVYCPNESDYKIVVDPDYEGVLGFSHSDFDVRAANFMERLLDKKGPIYVNLSFDNFQGQTTLHYPAEFTAIFDPATGKLSVFDRKIHEPAISIELSVGITHFPIEVIKKSPQYQEVLKKHGLTYPWIMLDVGILPATSYVHALEIYWEKDAKQFRIVSLLG